MHGAQDQRKKLTTLSAPKRTTDPGFEAWVDSHGYREYVERCAGGTLGSEAPAITALRDAYERERIAMLAPTWWWRLHRSG